MVAILKEGLYLIELSLRVIGGPACRGPLKIMLESGISAKDMP